MSDGAVASREIVEHPGAVGVVALDDEGNVLLVSQYRHPVRMRLQELPAGLLDLAGEPALRAAQRELAEEARVQAREWAVLVDLLTSPGMTDEAIRLFLARGIEPLAQDDFEAEHEELELEVTRVPLDEAVRRVQSGEIQNAAACAGLLAAVHARDTGWAGLRPVDAPWPARKGH